MTARRQLPDGTIVSCAGPPRCPTRYMLYRGDVAGLFDVPPEALGLPATEALAVNLLREAFPAETVSTRFPGDEEERRACAHCGDLVEVGLSSRDWCNGCEEEADEPQAMPNLLLRVAPEAVPPPVLSAIEATRAEMDRARNPEQDVIDEIDRLVDEQMANGGPAKRRSDPCPGGCGGPWHGLRIGDCPGATGIDGNPDQGARRDDDVFAHGQETYNSETSAPPDAFGYRARPGTSDIRARPGSPSRGCGDPIARIGSRDHPNSLLFPRPWQPRFTVGDGDSVTMPVVAVTAWVASGGSRPWDSYNIGLAATDSVTGEREEQGLWVPVDLLAAAPSGAVLGRFMMRMLGCQVSLVLDGYRVVAELHGPFGAEGVIRMGFGG